MSRSHEDMKILSGLLIEGLRVKREIEWMEASARELKDLTDSQKKMLNRELLAVRKIFATWKMTLPVSITEYPIQKPAEEVKLKRIEKSKKDFRR